MEFSKKIIGERLRLLRIERGVLAKEIADYLGFAKSSVSQIEHGIHAPDLRTIFALAIYFDVSIDYLVGLSEIKERR